MRKITQLLQLRISLLIALLFVSFSMAQVGIGTTNPDASSSLDISSTNSGLLIPRMNQNQRDLIGTPATGLLIFQTDNTPGFYYYDGTSWILLGSGTPSTTQIVSNTLTEDVEISKNTPGMQAADYDDIPLAGGGSFSVTFTATQTEALVTLTSSGFGYTNSMAYIAMRVMNGATSIGGTMNKIQSYDDLTGTITTWSLSFSKMITGLVVGTSYTLTVEAYAEGISGVGNAVIQPASGPDQNHLTLTVIQE